MGQKNLEMLFFWPLSYRIIIYFYLIEPYVIAFLFNRSEILKYKQFHMVQYNRSAIEIDMM